MPVLTPLIRMPSPHRRNPGALRNGLPPPRQRFLHLLDRRRVFQDGVIPRPVSEAHDVDMRFNQTGHHGPAAEVDHANAAPGFWRPPADRHEAPIPNAHGTYNGVAAIHRMNLPVD